MCGCEDSFRMLFPMLRTTKRVNKRAWSLRLTLSKLMTMFIETLRWSLRLTLRKLMTMFTEILR